MAQQRKILVSLSDTLLKEADTIAKNNNMNRSEFIRSAMKLYIREQKKASLYDKMKKGYLEMADINLQLADECYLTDCEQLYNYEAKLSECE